MGNSDWVQRYGDHRSPAQIKRLPRAEMISVARSCCLLECLSDEEIEAASTAALKLEIDSVVAWMEAS